MAELYEILLPNEDRAREYQVKNWTEDKVLLPDGSVVLGLLYPQKVEVEGTVPVSGDFYQSTQPVSKADGIDVVQGSLADAAIVTDANGTISGKLRGIIKLLLDQITVKLAAGVNLIGQVGIDQTTPGTTNAVAAKLIDEAGVSYGIQQVDNKPRVSVMPYLYDIAEKNVAGHEIWAKLGFNSAVTTSNIISPQGGVYVFPVAEQHMHIIGGAEDKADGTGIQELTIYYLDDTYAQKSVDVVPTGAAAAETSVSDIFRIQHIRAKTVGTGGVAAGNISIKNHAETITYGFIEQGHTRQRQAVWTVPAGKNLYIVLFNTSAINTAANKYCTITLMATYDDKADIALSAGLFFMTYSEISLENTPMAICFNVPLRFVAGTDLIVVGTGNGTATVSVGLRGWLEDS